MSYTTESGGIKSVSVGVGTSYISDIKYNTRVTINPNTLSGYTWEKTSTTITYNGETTVTLNAYIYPSSVAISGNSAIQGGNSATYTAIVAPSNVDIEFTYSWSLSSSANASISSSSGNQCTITTQSVETEENLTLTCVVTTTDGRKVQKTFDIALQTRPNFLIATYNVTSTTSATNIVRSYYLSNVSSMEIDGVQVTPVSDYTFSHTGLNEVKLTLKKMAFVFGNVKQLVSVDFSNFNGSLYDTAEQMFSQSGLTQITWGECTFPNLKSAVMMFSETNLEALDASPFTTNEILSLEYFCSSCKSLQIADFSSLGNVTIKNMNNVFWACSNLSTIYLPWTAAPTINSNTFGYNTSYYTGYNTRGTGKNMLYIPANATGYDSGYWLDPLCDASKCGFTISKTL